MSRSKYDESSINEGKSIRFLEGVIEDNGWKYRRQEKDNDIDGEIEVFSEGETTAKMVKVQLKATTNMYYKENSITFGAPVRFMNFCDVCDIPTILVVYDVEQQRAFWLWTQHYISQTLDNNNANWRNNTSEVTVHIPIGNEVIEDKCFYDKLEEISNQGVNEIQQLRKRDTSQYYFKVLKEDDTSSGSKKRISAKVYVERSFATSKESMVELIAKINENFKQNYYDKGVWDGKEINNEPDYIWLYFYNDLIQLEYGLPFCRTEWIKDDNPSILLKNNPQIIKGDIRVSWEEDRHLDKYLQGNTTTKRGYLKYVLPTLNLAIEELQKLSSLFQKEDKKEFYDRVSKKQLKYSSHFLLLSDVLPPYECKTLQDELNNVLCDIDNLALEINSGNQNEMYLHKQYVSKFNYYLITLHNEITKLK